jgi:O-acetyl-ADP-ribose deacetylase (regulator of RNase III)
MINYTRGDMFAHEYDVYVNLVNCVGAMGRGVAEQCRDRWPAMYEAYRAACRRGLVRPGALHTWDAPGGAVVVNLPTKRHWREPSRLEDVTAGLAALRDFLSGRGRVSVALPPPGCGHGGLRWGVVRPAIESALGDLDAEVTAFLPRDLR